MAGRGEMTTHGPTAEGNAVLVNVLSSSLRSTLNGLGSAPGLIRQVLEEESWRSFVTPRGELVEHDDFASFVTTAPTAGLGQTLDEVVRVIGDDVYTLDLLAQALGVASDSLRGLRPAADGTGPIAKDARFFGAYARSGGWVFGLMVARSVQPGTGQPGSSSRSERHVASKVSAKKFALMAGTTPARVMRFYKAWDRAAQAGIVPAFEALVPGQETVLPEPEVWGEYFTKFEQSTERRESIAEQAEASGTSYAEAVKVANNPAALRTAILGDAKTAEAARIALTDRMQDDVDLQINIAKTLAQTPELRKAVSTETRRAERTEYVRQAAGDGKVRTPAGQVIELPTQAKEKAAAHLALVQDPGASPEAVSEAYEAVHALINEAVEADPDIQTREQRTRFSRALSATAKSIEGIDPDDLIAVADDDLREKLASLQKQVNELAGLIVNDKPGNLRAV
ncbi:hypothetical protein ABIA33_005591 [Streptacidiphilus sp. MAP12-16]|uniref:hypothetical protein n=1 Tax=Streptacidiphilus sp. MAP12-16 TaxID=3156300 RepID=UPI0035155FAE